MLSRLGRALTARAADARRHALLAIFLDPPKGVTLGELLDAVRGTPYEEALLSLTIGELVGRAGRDRAVAEQEEAGESAEETEIRRRVRTRAEKLALDTAILDVLRARSEGLDLPALAERVLATPEQTKSAIDRLIERDRVAPGGTPDVPLFRAR